MDGSNMGTDQAYTVASDELRSFVERIEAERAEQAESKEREKEIFAELKGRGYMARPLRTLIKLRAQDPNKRAEEDAILETYKAALGMQ